MMGLLATAYTALGGLAAVVWTDAIQFVILVGGAIWVAISLANGVEGGAAEILSIAKETGRLHIADWRFNLFAMTGPAVAISFFFQLMQDYGTDQVTVQRLMATGSMKKTIKSVAFNACTDFFIIALLMFIGLGLFAFFRTLELPPGITSDKVMPYYIIHFLPQGVSGLLITAVFAAAMSSMDSGINSIATVVINDFARGVGNQVRLARILTVVLGILATALAFYVSTIEGILKAFFSFMGMFSAPVLALFLLGVLTKKGTFKGWLAGLAVSLASSIWIQKFTQIHEIYYFPFSFLVTFTIALAASRLFQQEPSHERP
jgi:SSS family solute:Na+ symporter